MQCHEVECFCLSPNFKFMLNCSMQDVNVLVILLFGAHRNVLKATVDVPQAGEVNFHCTHLDHLDEDWRMKQLTAIIQSDNAPHILAGGLNSLDQTDYSIERWMDIVKVK